MKMDNFLVRNHLSTSLASPTFAYTICVYAEHAALFHGKQNLVTIPIITLHSSLDGGKKLVTCTIRTASVDIPTAKWTAVRLACVAVRL